MILNLKKKNEFCNYIFLNVFILQNFKTKNKKSRNNYCETFSLWRFIRDEEMSLEYYAEQSFKQLENQQARCWAKR